MDKLVDVCRVVGCGMVGLLRGLRWIFRGEVWRFEWTLLGVVVRGWDESNPTKCSFFIFNEFSFWVVSYNWMLRLDNV